MSTILVTGASGTIGRTVLERLAPQQRQVRALVRNAPADPVPTVDYRIYDLSAVESIDRALDGVDTVYLSCGNVPEQVTYETTVIDRAAACGVARVVKLSAHGAAADAPVAFWRWHAQIEQHLVSSGIDHVLLRPHFLMSNLLGAIHTASTMGMVFAPAGDAAITMVDPRDVADVAVAALTDPSAVTGVGRALTVTGGERVGFDRVASTLARALDREVAYVDVPPAAAREQMVQAGLPEMVADEILNVFAVLRDGGQAEVTDVVPRLTGHEARIVADYLGRQVSIGQPVG
jgi:uncharacterized protein YbjT (DUF2867 family)